MDDMLRFFDDIFLLYMRDRKDIEKQWLRSDRN